MKFEWDEAKRQQTLRERGIDFIDVPEIFSGPLLTAKDLRQDYGENRFIGYGFLQQRLMVVVYTERDQDTLRIISLRKANKREKKQYEAFFETKQSQKNR